MLSALLSVPLIVEVSGDLLQNLWLALMTAHGSNLLIEKILGLHNTMRFLSPTSLLDLNSMALPAFCPLLSVGRFPELPLCVGLVVVLVLAGGIPAPAAAILTGTVCPKKLLGL